MYSFQICLSVSRFRIWIFAALILTVCLSQNQLALAIPEKNETSKTNKSLYELNDVVVTASRGETLLAETPDTVQIITREDIEEINPVSTGELFQYVTGVSIETGTGSGLPDRSIIGLDGLGGNRTLVLVDGVRLLSEHIHTGQNIESIPPQAIERIEILRGAASAQYGSDAVGGVVNIITRKAGEETEIGLGAKSGSYGYFDSSLNFLMPVDDKIKFSHFLYWEQSDGVDIEAPAHRKDYMGYDRLNSFNRLDIKLNESTDVFGVWNYVCNTMDWFKTPHRKDSDLKFPAIGVHHRINENLDLTAQLAYSSWWAEQSNEKNTHLEPRAFLTWRGMENHTILTGFDNKYNEFERSGIDKLYDQSAYGLFVQDNWYLSPEWSLTSALRFDKVEGIDSAISPKLSVLYNPDWLDETYLVRASVGRSFHAPTLQELYEEGYGHGGRALRYGNPNLKPEYAWSYSLGLETTPDKAVSTNWRVFLTDFDDMIVPVYEQNLGANDLWRRENIADATVHGAEVGLRWNINERLKFNTGYTFTDNQRDDTDGQLPYSPGSSAFAKLVAMQPIARGIKLRTFVGTRTVFNREFWSWKPAAGAANNDPSGLVTPIDDYIDLSAGVSCFLGENLELLFKATNLLGDEITNMDDLYTIQEGDPAYYVGFNYKMVF